MVVMVGRGESLKLVHVAARCYVEATSTQRGRDGGGGRERRKNESRRVPSAPLRLFLLPALPHPRGRVVPPLVGHPFFGKGQTRAAADFGTRRLKSYEPRVPIARVSPSPRAHMREGGEEGHQD